MEVHAIDTLSGREEPLEIDPDARVSTLKRRCGRAFGFGEDVELSVGGQRVACDGAECVSSVAAFSGGCQVGVVRGVAKFVAYLRRGAVKIDTIPVWAQQRRECVLAVLARALRGMQGGDDEDDDEEVVDTIILPHWVHPSLHDDKEVMLQFVRCDPHAFLRASPELRSDADVVIAALQNDASMWQHVVDKSLQEQRSVALVAVPYCANSAVWLSDKAFVLEALERSMALKLADVNETLQQDKEVVMKALDNIDMNFGTLSEELRGDKEVAMKALRWGELKEFRQLSAALQQDKEVVMKALGCRTAVHFGDLSEAQRGDKEVAMKAFRYGKLEDFHHLSATLQEDKEVVMQAFGTTSVRFDDLSESLRGDKELAMKALSFDRLGDFCQLSEALRGDKELAMKALDADSLKDFRQLSTTLQEDEEVVLKALECRIVFFGDLSESLQTDKSFVMRAVNFPEVYTDISNPLRQDKDVVLAAISESSSAFVSISTALRDDLDVALAAIRADPCNFVYAGDSVRADRRAALAAFCVDEAREGDPPVLLPFASVELQADPEVVLAAVRANPQNAAHASCPLASVL